MKRFGVRKRARYYGGGLAILALVALTLFGVLPALASNVNDQVPPASGLGNVMPVDIGVGGNQSCSSQGLFPNMTGVQQTTDPSPPNAGSVLWPSGQGWNFKLTAGALAGYPANKGQSLGVDSQGNAAIVGIAIKGGTDNLTYDYRNTTQGWISADTNLHAPASKFTAGNPESHITQYYGVSQLVICWKPGPLTTISGNAFKAISGNPGLPGLHVTLTDTTTPGTQTATTDASGNYSFSALPGDSYTVCIQNPSFANAQTAPLNDTAGGTCTGAPKGYSITSLGTSGVSGENFGFQPYGSVSGVVYHDVNVNGAFDPGATPPDTGQSGWTISLYDGSSTTPVGTTTSASDGSYSIPQAFVANDNYTVCESAPSGTWAQTQPRPASATICKDVTGALPNGGTFTPTSGSFAATQNFGNADALPCTQPMGIDGYEIALAQCKPQTFSITKGIDPNNGNKPYVSLVVGDPTEAPVPSIEKITFDDPIQADGQPLYTGLQYSDTFPAGTPQDMPYCKVDPRDPNAGGLPGSPTPSYLWMDPAYATMAGSTSVLPGTDTSCIIAVTITSPQTAGDPGTLTVYVYSSVDSQRWPT